MKVKKKTVNIKMSHYYYPSNMQICHNYLADSFTFHKKFKKFH